MGIEVKELYYNNGTLRIRTHYLDGIKHGVEEGYDNKGNILSRTPYNNGRLHGVCKSYFQDDVYMEIPYKDGELHGIGVNRYDFGNDYFYYLYDRKVTKKEYRKHELTEQLAGI